MGSKKKDKRIIAGSKCSRVSFVVDCIGQNTSSSSSYVPKDWNHVSSLAAPSSVICRWNGAWSLLNIYYGATVSSVSSLLPLCRSLVVDCCGTVQSRLSSLFCFVSFGLQQKAKLCWGQILLHFYLLPLSSTRLPFTTYRTIHLPSHSPPFSHTAWVMPRQTRPRNHARNELSRKKFRGETNMASNNRKFIIYRFGKW